MQLFTKDTAEQLFEEFRLKRVMVIGDVMVDAYLWGNVDRISPEAPVPVVAVTRRSSCLGGAANVALNLKALGAETLLCSVVGNDHKGDELIQLLHDEHMDSSGILKSDHRITTTKFRIFGNRTQMLRVDEETTLPLEPVDTTAFISMLRQRIESSPWDVIIFQDYDKGLITQTLISEICSLAAARGIPVAVDPKRRHFTDYRGVALFKPNLKEFFEGVNHEPVAADTAEFQMAVDQFQENQQIEIVLITLSSEGVFVSWKGHGTILPAHVRDVSDVSGAGDTVISVAALGLACGLTPVQLSALGNLAGGLVCEEVGVVPVNREKLLRETLRQLT
ncbi:MAG: PfkB family carbohydrate kinase [Bacteroidales bacterium]